MVAPGGLRPPGRRIRRGGGRDVELRTAGYAVLRFKWQALTREREFVVAGVSACLALAGVFEAA